MLNPTRSLIADLVAELHLRIDDPNPDTPHDREPACLAEAEALLAEGETDNPWAGERELDYDVDRIQLRGMEGFLEVDVCVGLNFNDGVPSDYGVTTPSGQHHIIPRENVWLLGRRKAKAA